MRILQVNTADSGGGAEAVARGLFQAYRSRGHWSRLAVGTKSVDDPDIVSLSRHTRRGIISRLARRVGGERLVRIAHDPMGVVATLRGSEEVNAPASWNLLNLFLPDQPEVLHLHNLHGSGYFDLRALPWLSTQLPLVLTLHDGWLLSGHCAQALGCERWQVGCGSCPDLTLYPAIRRDATASNFQRKHRILAQTRAYFSAPSAWLLDRVRTSHLRNSIIEARVIANGVDTSTFAPGDKVNARTALGLPAEAAILLFVAPGGSRNQFKDQRTLRAAIERLGLRESALRLVCLVLGSEPRIERLGSAELWHIGYESSTDRVTQFYQAADLYVHASRADTFPLAVLEALSSGVPVVATAVGGIPEQIWPLQLENVGLAPGLAPSTREKATGVLVPSGDAASMANALAALLENRPLLRQLSGNARRDACVRFDAETQVNGWLSWYEDILRSHIGGPLQGPSTPNPARPGRSLSCSS